MGAWHIDPNSKLLHRGLHREGIKGKERWTAMQRHRRAKHK